MIDDNLRIIIPLAFPIGDAQWLVAMVRVVAVVGKQGRSLQMSCRPSSIKRFRLVCCDKDFCLRD
jgi:hypothetical protein